MTALNLTASEVSSEGFAGDVSKLRTCSKQALASGVEWFVVFIEGDEEVTEEVEDDDIL